MAREKLTKKNLTVKKILNAFKKTGLKPVQGQFIDSDCGEYCGCIVTALYCQENNIEPENLDDNFITDRQIRDWAANLLGQENFSNLVYGYDNTFNYNPKKKFCKMGREVAEKLGLLEE